MLNFTNITGTVSPTVSSIINSNVIQNVSSILVNITRNFVPTITIDGSNYTIATQLHDKFSQFCSKGARAELEASCTPNSSYIRYASEVNRLKIPELEDECTFVVERFFSYLKSCSPSYDDMKLLANKILDTCKLTYPQYEDILRQNLYEVIDTHNLTASHCQTECIKAGFQTSDLQDSSSSPVAWLITGGVLATIVLSTGFFTYQCARKLFSTTDNSHRNQAPEYEMVPTSNSPFSLDEPDYAVKSTGDIPPPAEEIPA